MWIEIDNGTKRFYDPEILDEPITFSSNRTCQVTEGQGRELIEKYDSISSHTEKESVAEPEKEDEVNSQ